MATDLTVMLDDRPGTLAALGEALGKAGVNLEGVCGLAGSGGKAEIHLLVQDAPAAKRALEGAGHKVAREQEVAVLSVEDRPGGLGALARKIADAGANINLLYLATNTRVVVGADDLAKVRQATGR